MLMDKNYLSKDCSKQKVFGCELTKATHEKVKEFSEATDLKVVGIIKRAMINWLEGEDRAPIIETDIFKDWFLDTQKFSCKIPADLHIAFKTEAIYQEQELKVCLEDAVLKYLQKFQ